jgi:SAM-dependent methyltransferase
MVYYTPMTDASMDLLSPSRLVRRYAATLIRGAKDNPVLDVACGSGRNSFFLASLGCSMVCLDLTLKGIREEQVRLSNTDLASSAKRLRLVEIDLTKNSWPFLEGSVGGIINVHFTLPVLFPLFANSLIPGGYLLLETVPGCGGNYLQLPKAKSIRSCLESAFDFEFYRETRVGPKDADAVTVQLLGRKRG